VAAIAFPWFGMMAAAGIAAAWWSLR
jgi:hypothetical protein